MVGWSEILGYVAAVIIRPTWDSEFKFSEEVGGVDEGDLLSEWYLDFDLGVIYSSGPPSSAKYVEARKSGRQQGGYHPVRTLVGSSLSIWYSGSDWG